jgi:hypothetical protein
MAGTPRGPEKDDELKEDNWEVFFFMSWTTKRGEISF